MFIPILINGFMPTFGPSIFCMIAGSCVPLLGLIDKEEKPVKRRKEFYPCRVEFAKS